MTDDLKLVFDVLESLERNFCGDPNSPHGQGWCGALKAARESIEFALEMRRKYGPARQAARDGEALIGNARMLHE